MIAKISEECTPNLSIALIHYPVLNKNGDIIASAVTNLDLHDISRAARTYGVRSFYVVTPLSDQKKLVQRIISHWVSGIGSKYNPKRREALELISINDSLKEVVEHVHGNSEEPPKIVVTCAKDSSRRISFGKFREMIHNGGPYILLFGTGWGLTEKFMSEADYVLEPIKGNTKYNHLSVRTAAAIVLDRLLGV